MPPRPAATGRASIDGGIVIELIVPYYIEEIAVIYLVECGAQWVGGRPAYAATAFLELLGFIAGINKLLTECVVLYLAAKQALSLLIVPTARKGFRVEFKNEPPIDRMASFQ